MEPSSTHLATAASPTAAGLDAMTERLLGLFQDGGPILAILAVVSVVALTLTLLKLLQFAHLRVGARGFVPEALALWGSGRTGETDALLAATPNPIAPILAAAMRGLADTDGEPSPAVREEVLREAAAQQKRLASHARGLDLIATLAPLLGLLGTVLGMIDAFRELEAAGGRADPSLLAGGIWEALLTTAAGLAIAIPAAAAVHWIESVVEGIRHDAEDAVTRIFTGNLPAAPTTAPPRGHADAR